MEIQARIREEDAAVVVPAVAFNREVEVQIRQYRRLSTHDSKLGAEIPTVYDVPQNIGEGI